ncbi:MAG TPA: hypothetical protein VN841_24905 [Bryobacteraceae bacterium]|nr:hypothetical protein [Bryobacteraceae bacterium]
MIRRLPLAGVAVFAAALCACTKPQESGVKVIVGARFEPGAGRPAIEYSVIVVADGKFRAVGAQSATPVPKGSEITGGLGMTVRAVSDDTPIEVGRDANLVLQGGGQRREMRNGEWVH